MCSRIVKNKPPVLRPEEEGEILKTVIEKAKAGERVLREDVIKQVIMFLKSDNRKNPFRNDAPGDKWFSLFRRRHNHEFQKLSPKMLKNVEKVGFTEKVTNTVTYPRSPTSYSRKNTLSPPLVRRKSATTSREVTPPPHPSPAMVMCSPMSEEGSNTSGTDEGDTCKSQESHCDSNDFLPGSKLEVMDFNEKWYPVKVVEVDYEEGEVLVHFEKWSDRYDEWMRVDSNRIRRPQLSQSNPSKKVFEENEKVIAVWAYNHKYPATVRQVLPNDKYEVLFCDGYAKVLRGCKLFKASEEDLKNVKLPPPKKPAPPMGADPLDPNLGPKEERRLKKRRLDVLESYLPQKRQRIEPQQSTPESSPQPVISTHRPKETPRVVFKMRGRPPLKHKKRMETNKDDDDDDDKYIDEDNEPDHSEPERTKPEPNKTKIVRRRKRKKKPFDESSYIYRGSQRHGVEEDSERWNTEIPEGVTPVQIKDQEGYYRESIIIPDKKMPPGWTKHTMRRKSGAKWDVFLVNPAGRKFRSRNELRTYFAELKQPFPDESFDFMVGRKMEMIRSQTQFRKKLLPGSSLIRKCLIQKVHKKSNGEGESKKSGETSPDSRRIKTMLPKGRHLDSGEDTKDIKQEFPGQSSAPPPLMSPPFPLTELRTPDGGFTCCGKTFRKENLFQMHMKHYHPEYSNLFGSTPNVADLAYARTVGEPLEDSRAEAMTPKNSLIERVNKYEAERKAFTDTMTTPDTPGSKQIQEKETVIQIKVEEPLAVLEKTADEQVPVKKEIVEDVAVSEELKEDEKPSEIQDQKDFKDVSHKEEEASPPENVEEIIESPEEKVEKSTTPPAVEELPPAQPSPAPSPPPPPPPIVTTSIPVIRPVSKVTSGLSKATVISDAVIMQTSSSSKIPIITKYIPPGQKPLGQKPSSSFTKLTISTASSTEKETKPTIKTLLPMRPPLPESKEVQDIQKPKEHKPKDEPEEEIPIKSRPRKRTVSESLPKKAKLVKPSTGSLEEVPPESVNVPMSPTANNTSYRFSRNRSQIPMVSLEKLNLTPDSNGRVVLTTPEDKISNTAGGVLAGEEIASGSDLPTPTTTTQDVVYENLRKEEIINCTCGYMEEDGLMIQCDLCLCWQHGLCNNIDKEADVPEKYVCYICQHPARQRTSTKYLHNQDWLKEGKLPSFSFRPKSEESVVQRESTLKKSHDLVASLLQLKTIIRSLRVKTHIATKPDHPKLYLWAKSWKNESSEIKNENEEDTNKQEGVSGPQPEAAIDETECRLRLLEHVEDYQHQVDDRLTSIQAQIAALESEDPDLASDEASDHYPVTKQTVQMVLHDLSTLNQVAALN